MLKIDFNNGVVQAAPIAGTAGADMVSRMFWGMSLHEWFYVATIAYIIIQSWALIYRTIKGGKQDERQKPDSIP